MREVVARVRAVLRGDRGEADPVLVMMSLVVVVLVTAGITAAVVVTQRWASVYAADAAEQTGEDAARLAWLADVGSATAVEPGAGPGGSAATSVRLHDATPEADWGAGLACRAVTWWLDDPAPAQVTRPNSREPGQTVTRDLVQVHRQVEFYDVDPADPARCYTTDASGAAVTPVRRSLVATPIGNALPGARFAYTNGHLRDLEYVAGAHGRVVEVCEEVPAGDEAALAACAGDPVPGRTLWEWADPEPAQVALVMVTDQAGAGEQYATQVAWREGVGRRELTGDPDSPVRDTLDNPPAPAAPQMGPAVAQVVVEAPDDGSADYVTVTRTDERDLAGVEYRCQETLDGAAVRWLPSVGAGGAPTADLDGTVTVPDTRPGHAYVCYQRGWVTAVTPPQVAGTRFAEGVSAWSPPSEVATRRPAATTVSGSLNADDSFTFTWEAREGATGFEAQFRVNAGGEWVDLPGMGPEVTSWTSPVFPRDTRVFFRVRPVNDGGAPRWASDDVASTLGVPQVTIEPGAVGKDAYTATWVDVDGFDAELGHRYEVQVKVAASAAWSDAVEQVATSAQVSGVLAGRTASVRVRTVGVNGGASEWSAPASATRPVKAPAAPAPASIAPQTGGVSTSATPVTCEPGTVAEYNVWGSLHGWRGWSTATSHTFAAGEGAEVYASWMARCRPGEGIAAESGQVGTGTVKVPYTAPATPTLYAPSSGNAGTYITFDWNDTGGYYQVVNSNYNHRGYTTTSQLTVLRETGQTCARVRAARNAEAAGQGVWSGWSSMQCGTTLVPAPSVPTDARVSGAKSMGAYMTWTARSWATYYRYTLQIRYSTSEPWEPLATNVTTTATTTPYHPVTSGAGYAQARGQAQACNNTGCSSWSAWHYYVLP
jgi:hypothetical protein